MAERASRRAAYNRADFVQSHLHGTSTACPCGSETGVTCVVIPEDWVPETCEVCGKLPGEWGDGRSIRAVQKHAVGCWQYQE
jgi:hypothetical protein